MSLSGQLVSTLWLRGCALIWTLLLHCLPQQLKREVCVNMVFGVGVCKCCRDAEPQPLGRPGSSAGYCDSSRQQQAAGPGPPSGLPLSGTSCVCGHQPLVPPSPLCSKPPPRDPLLQCTLVGGHNDTFCCPILLSLPLTSISWSLIEKSQFGSIDISEHLTNFGSILTGL